jgi:virginiamycin B lyase
LTKAFASLNPAAPSRPPAGSIPLSIWPDVAARLLDNGRSIAATTTAPTSGPCQVQIAPPQDSTVAISTAPTQHIALPDGAAPTGIVVGAGRDLWFADTGGGRVGRLSTDGRLTLWSFPGSTPGFPAVDSDGGAWVPDQAKGRMLHVTASGQASTCRLPSITSGPFAAIRGPDGAIWITERSGNRIARMATDGRVREFVIPGQSGNPIGIAAGPDGMLWFTEELGGAIGRVSVAGQIALFPLPDRAQGIACSPRQALNGPNRWNRSTPRPPLGLRPAWPLSARASLARDLSRPRARVTRPAHDPTTWCRGGRCGTLPR